MRVAITGFGGLDEPDSGLSVARSLRAGWQGQLIVHALGYDEMMTSAWMPGVADYLHVLPQPSQGETAVLSRILALNTRYQFDALIPCVDDDIAVFASLAPRLRKAGIKVLIPDQSQFSLLERPRLPDFVFEHQILAPASNHVTKLSDVQKEAERLRFPLLVKHVISGQQLVTSGREAKHVAEKMIGDSEQGVVLQQVVYGDEYSVALVADEQGKSMGQVAIRKLAINDDGESECGTVVDDPWINQFVEDLLGLLKWQGPLELEFVRQTGATQLWLKDIHCRFPNWIILSHWANFNLPLMMLKEMTKSTQNITGKMAKTGAIYMQGVSESAIPENHLNSLEKLGSAEGINPHGLFSINGDKGRPSSGIIVAITGISTFNMINPGLGIARALRHSTEIEKIYGLNYGTFDSGSFQTNLFDRSFRIPISEEPQELLERLKQVQQTNPIDVLIPSLDGELPKFFAIRQQLEALGISLLLPEEEAFEARSKLNLFTNHRDLGDESVLIPRSFVAYSLNDIYRAMSHFDGPVAIKGPLFGCVKAEHVDDAPAAWDTFNKQGEDRVIVQPWVEGEMIAVATVCNRHHETVSSMTAMKLANCKHGSTWSARQVSLPKLEEIFAAFLKQIKWVGPAEGEFLHDVENDRFFLLEINPRFTGWISFSGETGLNHPLAAVKTALGQTIKKRKNRDNLIFMRSSYAIEIDPIRLASLSVNGQVNNHG